MAQKVWVFRKEKLLLGQRLRALCISKNISFAELSRKSGIELSDIYKIESGKNNYTLDTYLSLLNVLRVTIFQYNHCPSLDQPVERVRSEWRPERS